MGSSHSSERLNTPLYAQQQPFLATAHGLVVQSFTSLCVKPPSFSKVYDTATSRVALEMKSAVLNSRCTIVRPDGRELVSLKSRSLSSGYHVYDGGDKSEVVFDINIKLGVLSTTVVYATFYDRLSGELCRVLIEGPPTDRVAIAYIERGQSALLALPSCGEDNAARFQAIGRIRRPHAGLGREEFFVEAAPGVDITLLLLLSSVRYDMLERHQQHLRQH